MENFYDLEVKTPKGETIKMESFKGKVVLIVNTAQQSLDLPHSLKY